MKYRKNLTPLERKVLIEQDAKYTKYAQYILNESPTALSQIEWLLANLSSTAERELNSKIRNL